MQSGPVRKRRWVATPETNHRAPRKEAKEILDPQGVCALDCNMFLRRGSSDAGTRLKKGSPQADG